MCGYITYFNSNRTNIFTMQQAQNNIQNYMIQCFDISGTLQELKQELMDNDGKIKIHKHGKDSEGITRDGFSSLRDEFDGLLNRLEDLAVNRLDKLIENHKSMEDDISLSKNLEIREKLFKLYAMMVIISESINISIKKCKKIRKSYKRVDKIITKAELAMDAQNSGVNAASNVNSQDTTKTPNTNISNKGMPMKAMPAKVANTPTPNKAVLNSINNPKKSKN